MGSTGDQAAIFRFLFRLAARARDLTGQAFLQRLVTGIANRYGAASCSIYRYGRVRATAWAPEGPEVAALRRDDRVYLHNLDGRLAQEAMRRHGLVSALDLHVDGDVHAFLDAHFPEMDIFAFPLMVREGPRGAIVIYLPQEADSLTDADIHALMSIGEILRVAEEGMRDERRPEPAPRPSRALRSA